MLTLKASLVAVMLCLMQLPSITPSPLFKYKRMGLSKRGGFMSRTRVSRRGGSSGRTTDIFFKGNPFDEVTKGVRHGNLVLECSCGGATPTIHWLRNGVRMQQGDSHNIRDDEASYESHTGDNQSRKLRLATTNSKLYLNCLNDDHNAVYTCVAETPTVRISRSTSVKVVKSDFDSFQEVSGCIGKRSAKAEPAKIYMWTSTRLEYEGGRVQLYCRAQGNPAPTITWYDVNNNPIVSGDNYKIVRNGDLIINNVTFFENMGLYTCEADNGFGTDSTGAFLYPTAQDK